jgi:hypothetical protein
MHITKGMHDMLGPGQQRQVALNDKAVETVIYKNQEAFKELLEGFHRSPPQMFGSIPKSSVLATGGIKGPHYHVPTLSPWNFKGAALGYV